MPAGRDGRDIDTAIAVLSGEAASQQARGEAEQVARFSPEPWDGIPSRDGGQTYYDRPLLKESVWSIDIPIYYFVGGAAGAALAVGSALQLTEGRGAGRRHVRAFARECHWIGVSGSTIGAAFLIHDLGRPTRFLAMVRVFRPTSPMNVGAWILSTAAPAAIVTALLINRPGIPGLVGEIAGYTSGAFGTALAIYTGVLVASTAVPVWQEARRWMPVLFASSAAASAAAILDLRPHHPDAERVISIFGTVGRIGELAAGYQVERAASAVPRVAAPLRSGASSTLWKAAKVLTAASLVVSLAPGKSPAKRRVAAVLAATGSLCLRFAVHYITNASARDPRAVFDQQRRGSA
jgi:formate-dependent nitrite reductase membrane component NrfD